MFYEGKRLLVTGGAGFVGTHFVRALLARGARIRVPIHRRPMIVQDPGIEVVQADLSRLEDCRGVCDGVNFVIHAAGSVGAAGNSTSHAVSSITLNLVLTAQMLQAAAEMGVQRFLVFSSSTGYPVADHPVKEEEMWGGPPHPAYFGYGWMRRYLERMSEFLASKLEIGIAIVRPTAIYGRYDNFDSLASHVIPALIRRAVAREDPFEVWGTGNEVRDFLHVTDLVTGSLLALEKHAVCDPLNIGHGKAVTVNSLVRTVLTAAGHSNATVVFNPSRPTVIPVRKVDTSKAERTLGFVPSVSLEQGIADTVAWYRDCARAEGR
ncbi:MAG: NAD-dependent epimerase/dehydratase family protein [Betaproteobacteria bacterium]|nr:NAD-dependent epimerase/dehydratase family protein [Betaproteobacteria bacterium]MDH3414361.1 NAD-dependent epimerase/dehydratase family protein [Gammaproteobacteria bacterium]